MTSRGELWFWCPQIGMCVSRIKGEEQRESFPCGPLRDMALGATKPHAWKLAVSFAQRERKREKEGGRRGKGRETERGVHIKMDCLDLTVSPLLFWMRSHGDIYLEGGWEGGMGSLFK